jgi:valyl-tRNA synthetase
LKEIQKEILQLDGKLKQPDFVNKAPADVVEKNQLRLSEAQLQREKLEVALTRLQSR